jgi:MinD-like ATPase involved in chromosome partitioning or flagellar assembly
VRAHTSQNKATRLEVLTGPDFVSTRKPLQESELDAVMPILGEHYSLVLMDTGTGLKTNLMTSILGQSRALVVVSSASIDALEETQVTLDWLRHNGYQQLLDTAVLVINTTVRGKLNVDVDKAVERFSRQIRAERIVVCPFDTHIHEGKEITLELLSPKSRRRYLELAAAVADLFPKIAD